MSKSASIRRALGLAIAGVFLPLHGTCAQAPVAAAPSAVPKLEFLFTETVLLGAATKVGATPFGDRNIVPITGGTFEGPSVKGQVLPGGWDWQLTTATGCFRLKADYMIRTDDGVVINVINQGTACRRPGAAPERILTVPTFEAPLGKYEWLNGGAYVGTLDVAPAGKQPAVRISFYKAS